MSLKNNNSISGIIFIFSFVLQQIIALLFMSYNYYKLYSYVIVMVTILIGLKQPLLKKEYQYPFIFMLVCVIGSFMTLFNGSSLGSFIFKSLYAFIGYIGFVYISENRINLRLFNFLFIILYIFYYSSYFMFDEFTRKILNGDLFGTSSSNTIAISLNIILFFYFILKRSYKESNYKVVTFIAIINLVLIIIQGSRAGIVVAFILLLLCLSELFNFKKVYFPLILFSIISLVVINNNYDKLLEIMELDRMQGLKSIEEDVRGVAQRSFFYNLNFANFFLGYPSGTEFTFETTRTFNAFIDFWNRFGFIPFLSLIIFLLRRIFNYKRFDLSLLFFTPLIIYSLVESLWGGNSWDILIYFLLFYSYKSNEFDIRHISYLKRNHSMIK